MEERIKACLQKQIPEAADLAVEDLRKGSYGASMETFFFTAKWIQDQEEVTRELVLRRSPETGIVESDRETEYRYREAYGVIPVQRVYFHFREARIGSAVMRKPPVSLLKGFFVSFSGLTRESIFFFLDYPIKSDNDINC